MSASYPDYPIPAPALDAQPFWDGTAQGKLLLKRCTDCGETHYYPRAICPYCFSSATQWSEATGRGTIYSFSVMRRALVPYVIAYVRLEEGVTMMTNIIDCDFDALAIDDAVRVVFHPIEGGVSLPLFTPA
jgi:hypothetical protein